MRFQIKNFQVLSGFKTKVLQRVRFQIKFFTTRQILKQNFQNISDFKSKKLKQVRFCFGIFLGKSDFEQKWAFKNLLVD